MKLLIGWIKEGEEHQRAFENSGAMKSGKINLRGTWKVIQKIRFVRMIRRVIEEGITDGGVKEMYEEGCRILEEISRGRGREEEEEEEEGEEEERYMYELWLLKVRGEWKKMKEDEVSGLRREVEELGREVEEEKRKREEAEREREEAQSKLEEERKVREEEIEDRKRAKERNKELEERIEVMREELEEITGETILHTPSLSEHPTNTLTASDSSLDGPSATFQRGLGDGEGSGEAGRKGDE